MGDKDIVELYWQRNDMAIAESQRVYGAYCFAVAYNILADPEDAEECVNDTWRRAWHAIPPVRHQKLSAFFGRITRNLSLDRYAHRRAARRGGGEVELALSELENCVGSAGAPEQAALDAELEAGINRFLRSLPERERNIFLCRYWDIKPLKEIAAKYGMKETNVKASLHRSREKLRRHLEKEGITV